MRGRAWRRYKNYTKAKRKRDIDLYDFRWNYPIYHNPIKPNYYTPNTKIKYGMYDNLHQYSKNKVHCSCPYCSAKTRNKSRRRYASSINYRRMDLRRQQAMTADINDYEYFSD